MLYRLKEFETFFRAVSYAVVFCGFFALFIAGGLGAAVAGLFLAVLGLAWFLEDTGRQISERTGTILIFIVVPLFYLGWKYRLFGFTGSETAVAGMLGRMILVLAGIKLLQKKSDRDWLFLYLMSFFEILLAAGMSISPLYFVSLILYFLVVICAVIAFEIRKTGSTVDRLKPEKSKSKKKYFKRNSVIRLPLTAAALLVLIVLIAAPLFFMLPRVGGAGLGGNGDGITGFVGFSDSVRLGAIGRLKQSDRVVMRAVLDKSNAENGREILWRGVALDTFNNNVWSKASGNRKEPVRKRGRFFRFDRPAESLDDIAVQTIYLEPIDSAVLFSLSRPYLAEQTSFKFIYRDPNGNISFNRRGFERISYQIYSDRRLPAVRDLRRDRAPYSLVEKNRYLQLPDLYDPRIGELAARLTAGRDNRFDQARAIERYLRSEFGYTLEMRAGGDEPLADFLFNVREGHCEYFASAMAVMLRSQGIATRIVNGFQQGEYNETAGVYIVRQREAHSWVEVYFPGEGVWVPFDPTPAAGRFNPAAQTGVLGDFTRYLEALETFWIQYFVAFDNEEQRSLFRTVKGGFSEFQSQAATWAKILNVQLADWWKEVRGDRGFQASVIAVVYGLGVLFALIFLFLFFKWLYRRILALEIWNRIGAWLRQKNEATIVEFYDRMQRVLAGKGFTRQPHQTPLEFAYALKMPEAVKITEKYNRVRFGEKDLSKIETEEIENWLSKLETADLHENNKKIQ